MNKYRFIFVKKIIINELVIDYGISINKYILMEKIINFYISFIKVTII